MAVSRGFRIGAVALLTALVFALGLVLASASGKDADAASGYKPPKLDQSRLLLRLTDLPPGYAFYPGKGLFCRPFTRSQDELPALGVLVRAYRLEGCFAAYERLYTPPGEASRAAFVFSGAIALGSRAAADAIWGLLPTLLGGVTEDKRKLANRSVPLTGGATTRFFRTSSVPSTYRPAGRKASFLAWRSGNVVAVVVAIGKSFAESDATVAELAPRQEEHIRKPTPYTGAERFDGEVALDDPAVDLPVYWLGRHFRPGGGIRRSKLLGSYFSDTPLPEREEQGDRATFTLGPEAQLRVNYEGISLDTWTPEDWPVFARSETAKTVTSWKCTKTRVVALPEGTATIFGGYEEDFARCPKGPPRVFTAWVEIGGVKVVVNAPWAAYFVEGTDPYASFEAMEAIVRGLTPRPQPVL